MYLHPVVIRYKPVRIGIYFAMFNTYASSKTTFTNITHSHGQCCDLGVNACITEVSEHAH